MDSAYCNIDELIRKVISQREEKVNVATVNIFMLLNNGGTFYGYRGRWSILYPSLN